MVGGDGDGDGAGGIAALFRLPPLRRVLRGRARPGLPARRWLGARGSVAGERQRAVPAADASLTVVGVLGGGGPVPPRASAGRPLGDGVDPGWLLTPPESVSYPPASTENRKQETRLHEPERSLIRSLLTLKKP